MKIYLSHKGEILEHNVILEDEEFYYVNRLNELQEVVRVEKTDLGVKFFDDFETAKKKRIEYIAKLIGDLETESIDVENQKEPILGKLKPERFDG